MDTFLVAASSSVIARFDFHTDTNPGAGITSVRFDDSASPSVYGATFNLHAVSQATGIASMQDGYNSIFISPNPATSELVVRSSESADKELTIFNSTGEKRLTLSRVLGTPKGEGLRVDVSSLAAGIYFVKIKTGEEMRVAKFVKQ